MEAAVRDVSLRYLTQLLSPAELADARADVAAADITAPAAPFVPTPFKPAELIAGINTAVGALCSLISRERLGKPQRLAVDVAHAASSLTSHFSFTVDDMGALESIGFVAAHLGGEDPYRWHRAVMNSSFRCRDGRYILIYLRPFDGPERLLDAFGFSPEEIKELAPKLDYPEGRKEYAERVSARIAEWDSAELERNMIAKNATACIVGQRPEDFAASEHGKLAATWPTVGIERREGWAPVPWTRIGEPRAAGILDGVKVLELTRVLLGPRGGCLLAALGATVIRVTSPFIDDGLALDTNAGKRSIHVDFKNPNDMARFRKMVADCDVFLSNNALGVPEKLGVGYDDVLSLVAGRPRGVVYAEANAFGFSGPLASAAGYEHLAHFLAGIGAVQGQHHRYTDGPQHDRPAPVPINVLDISTGHSLAMGVIEALRRRAREGGSYRVRTSLLQVGMMMQRLGLHDAATVEKCWEAYQPEPSDLDPERAFGGGCFAYFALFQNTHFRAGFPDAYKPEFMFSVKDCPWLPPGHTVSFVGPALQLSETPVRYRLSSRPFGFDKVPEFLPLEEVEDVVPEGRGFRFVGKREKDEWKGDAARL
ncbi:CoA-transferase family III domain-containing protein [Hyaloraphidium curvatum]|nr:CoA-transferase family III domain-containing protein [Hyaloraphidium curvatum]